MQEQKAYRLYIALLNCWLIEFQQKNFIFVLRFKFIDYILELFLRSKFRDSKNVSKITKDFLVLVMIVKDCDAVNEFDKSSHAHKLGQ